MKIETKYNIGDELFYMKDNKIHHSYVWAVKYEETMIGAGQRVTTIIYNINSSGDYKENELFLTKEELIKSL